MNDKINQDSGFSPDLPIQKPEDDRLNRNRFVDILSYQIQHIQGSECIVIGLYGPWGSGKSSILNLLTNKLEDINSNSTSQNVVVRFNPWNFSSIDQLIIMFFNAIKEKLGETKKDTYSKICKLIIQTSKILSPLNTIPVIGSTINSIGKTAENVKEILNKSLLEIKNEINSLLQKDGRKIIVMIDDIDRLDKASMLLMFRLINLNANFTNMRYVLAFDREITEQIIRNDLSFSSHDYLEKIIQVSFDLPRIDPYDLEQILFSELEKIVPPDTAYFDIQRWGNLYHGGFRSFFKTIRDIKRFINAFNLSYQSLKNETNPIDLLGIEVLRVFCPTVYNELASNKEILTYTEGISIYKPTNPNAEKEKWNKIFTLGGIENISAVTKICHQLFPPLRTVYENVHHIISFQRVWRTERRICALDMFDRYFLLNIPHGRLSEVTLQHGLSLSNDSTQFISFLKDMKQRELLKEFLDRFEDYLENTLPPQLESFIDKLIEFGDELPDDKTGLFDIGSDQKLRRIIFFLLKKVFPKSKRMDILLIEPKKNKSIWMVLKIIQMYIDLKDKNETNVFNKKDIKQGKKILLNKINELAMNNNLYNVHGFPYILSIWATWSNKKEPKEYVERHYKSKECALSLLDGYLRESSSYTAEDYVPKKKWTININSLKELIDPNKLKPIILEIKNTSYYELSIRKKILIDSFLETFNNNDDD